jgi:hypothetical protein
MLYRLLADRGIMLAPLDVATARARDVLLHPGGP